jgi:hypothetical protein
VAETVSGVVRTDAGMCALWSPASFHDVTDYGSWERELLDDADVARHVRAGSVVPINIGSDGTFAVRVRTTSGPENVAPTEREARFVMVSSEPYLFETQGGAFVSGLEHICRDPDPPALSVPIGPGRWAATVYLVDWEAEPGSKEPSGQPAPGALPDFLVVVNPALSIEGFRQEVATFERPTT